jgi:hypothetical protein
MLPIEQAWYGRILGKKGRAVFFSKKQTPSARELACGGE